MYCTNYHDDYTRNKADKLAIVSVDAKDVVYRTTADQLPNPESFSKWKKWSDKNYHRIHLGNCVYKDHNVSLGKFEYTLSTEQLEEDEAAHERIHLLYQKTDRVLKRILTQKQYRRFKMRYEECMSEDEIAAAEHVGQPSVSECLTLAKEQIEKHLQEFVNFL